MYNPVTHPMGYLSNDFYIHNSYFWIADKLGIPT